MSIDNTLRTYSLTSITTYQAGVGQASAHRNLQRICDEILRPFNITKMQWLIIGATLAAGKSGMRLTDLANELGTTMSYITREVNLLAAKGILVRSGHTVDHRSKLIFVANSYIKECSKIEATLRKGLRKSIYSDIDPTEFRVYLKVLFQLGQVK